MSQTSVLVVLYYVAYLIGPVLTRLLVLATVVRALPFFVVAALVANTGLRLRRMDANSRLTAPDTEPELFLLTAALPVPVLSAVSFARLPALWAGRR